MNWFRVYSEMKDDPKMLELDDHQFRLWMGMLSLASEGTERGVISNVRLRGLAAALRTDEDRLIPALELFAELEMIDHDETMRTITITHWNQRQYNKPSDTSEATRERKRQSRVRHADVTPDSRPITDTERNRAETETEQTETRAPAGDAPAPPEDESPEITQTAEILTLAPFVGDGYADVLPAVRRSFGLVPDVAIRDGPLLAEQFANWRGYRKKPPADWYRAWLNWLKRERDDERTRTTPTGPTTPAKLAGYGFDAAIEARQTNAAPG